jgi:hypothetical protein
MYNCQGFVPVDLKGINSRNCLAVKYKFNFRNGEECFVEPELQSTWPNAIKIVHATLCDPQKGLPHSRPRTFPLRLPPIDIIVGPILSGSCSVSRFSEQNTPVFRARGLILLREDPPCNDRLRRVPFPHLHSTSCHHYRKPACPQGRP